MGKINANIQLSSNQLKVEKYDEQIAPV